MLSKRAVHSHELVARQREQAALGQALKAVPRAAYSLQESCDRRRRAELTHEVDVTDVDSELERRSGDERLQLPGLEPLLRAQPMLFRETAVMRGDVLLAESFR